MIRHLQIGFIGLLLALPANAQSDGSVELWVRGAGFYEDGREIPREHLQKFRFKGSELAVRKSFDSQFVKSAEFRGIELATLIKSYKPYSANDLALLHFANGMIIPLPIEDDLVTVKRMDIFLAEAWRTKDKWSTVFPDVARKHEMWRDPVPIKFSGNKLVLKDGWHPYVKDKEFTPFRHADSLTGIEFVKANAYYRQFTERADKDISDPGLTVFRERCQYCHGVRKVGANFGWDFVDPVPIYDLKRANHLYNKVKYSYHDAIERGLKMPRQTSVTEQEMEALWKWIQRLGSGKSWPYAP